MLKEDVNTGTLPVNRISAYLAPSPELRPLPENSGTRSLPQAMLGWIQEERSTNPVNMRLLYEPEFKATSRELTDMDMARALLEGVYLLADHDTDKAVSMIYKNVNSLLRNGNFAFINAIFRSIDVARLPLNALVAFLAITWGAKAKLDAEARESYVERARPQMENERSPAHVSEVLRRFA